LITENDTIVDLIQTNLYSKNGDILKRVIEDPSSKTKTIDFFLGENLWYSLILKNNLKEDSTIYCHNSNDNLAFYETFSINGEIKKAVYNYSGNTIRKDNYLLGNNSSYVLISYEITEIDSIANTHKVKYVNIEDTYASQINLYSFDSNYKLISSKTLSNLDSENVIYELNYVYKDEQIQKEIYVDHEGIKASITFDYNDLDNNGNWTKKIAKTIAENGEEKEVGFEIRIIEYW
jgi:hypothetical protein